MAKRELYLDFTAGLLILYMIFTHVCQFFGFNHNEFYNLTLRIFVFFMPWFFFKGGMFVKENVPFENILRNSSKRLLFPYLLWTIIGSFVYYTLNAIDGTFVSLSFSIYQDLRTIFFESAVAGNRPLWFLLSLFIVRIIFYIIPRKLIWMVIITSLVVGYYLNYKEATGVPMIFANTINGLAFFLQGMCLKNFQFKKIVFGISLVIFLSLIVLVPTYVDMRANTVSFGYYIFWPMIALCGIITINNINRLLESRIGYGKLGLVFCNLGKNSMIVYVIHWPILIIVYNAIKLL